MAGLSLFHISCLFVIAPVIVIGLLSNSAAS
jgi:hypothetical protein